MSKPNGDGRRQYCPRCGAENLVHVSLARPPKPCRKCTWKIDWIGPLWGVAVRPEDFA